MKNIPTEALNTLPEGYEILGYGPIDTINETFIAFLETEWSSPMPLSGTSNILIYAKKTQNSSVHKKDGYVSIFPQDDEDRAKYVVGTFVCEFFPHAFAELSKFSYEQQAKHNDGIPTSWAKGKSIGNPNRVIRHLMEGWIAARSGYNDVAKSELTSLAWRGLELLERFLTKMEPFKRD